MAPLVVSHGLLVVGIVGNTVLNHSIKVLLGNNYGPWLSILSDGISCVDHGLEKHLDQHLNVNCRDDLVLIGITIRCNESTSGASNLNVEFKCTGGN